MSDDWDFDDVVDDEKVEVEKKVEQKEQVAEVKEAAVYLFDKDKVAALDVEGTDFREIFGAGLTVDDFNNTDEFIAILARTVMETTEGSVRDRLFNYGLDLSDVDMIMPSVHKMLAEAPVDVGGQYFSGEASDLLGDTDVSEIQDLFGGGKEDKKASKKTAAKKEKKYDNPVDEVYSMILEGQNLPIIYIQQFVGTEENYKRLLDMPGIKATEYYVMFVEDSLPEGEVSELRNRYLSQ